MRRQAPADWSTDAGPPLDEAPPPAPSTPAPSTPAQRPAPPVEDAGRLVKFTAKITEETSDRFERVTAAMRPVGRLAAGRYPSRADVLRAALALIEEDPALAERVRARIRQDLTDGQTD